jgi:CTP synthase (UTP-ammonia lyase)
MLKIAIIGDYDPTRKSHIATSTALQNTAATLSHKLVIRWLPTKSFEIYKNLAQLEAFDGIWGAPGVPESSLGLINAIQVAREKNIPYLGTWSGFQHALVEYAKNVLDIGTSQDFDNPSALFDVLITKMSCSMVNETQEIIIRNNSLAHKIYETASATENYNCSYSLNEDYRDAFGTSNLHCVGHNKEGDVRVIEIANHRFFLAMLFQPQLNSRESVPHPVVVSFLRAAGCEVGWKYSIILNHLISQQSLKLESKRAVIQ